jgi:hypothetical protein
MMWPYRESRLKRRLYVGPRALGSPPSDSWPESSDVPKAHGPQRCTARDHLVPDGAKGKSTEKTRRYHRNRYVHFSHTISQKETGG